ncbi:UDP-glucose 4-epimerase GalE [Chamaesiphon sp. OTE_75_metabat_556]|uniref:UDP-glucose 4-epimerase GalE n=1 Tax=Chamaesiphon sp. OTE_75_metabat_556 TaxID=2964692 RepID=UPI00286C3629|nr:UDP-glucose 4-epimerase GalE [Chamaesiphon sp. OTE_75_metabat_556]
MKKKILVTGGAGYIGSHTIKQLGEANYDLVVYDNLSTGNTAAISYGELVVGDLADRQRLAELFAEHKFNAVLHFAASISVPDSVVKPLEYYSNNTANTLNLLHCCQQFDVNKLIFSSTAAVYGQPEVNPITEETSPQPLNPYGSSKLMSERLIRDYAVASNLKYVILRYFNVAGAEIGGSLGQTGKKASHLLKVACDAALGQRSHVGIFGTDFDTPDGTGIRDYIHVDDLARAHVDALIYLNGDHPSQILNCGYGQGYSVREVIEKVKEISGVDFTVIEAERRAGDPACVIAANDRITKVLGWKPRFNDLDTIVRTALDWEKKLTANSQPIKELVG